MPADVRALIRELSSANPVPTENSELAAFIDVAANGGHAATMYKAVGISGCEPPQPPQFSHKINIIREFIAFATCDCDRSQPILPTALDGWRDNPIDTGMSAGHRA